MRMGYWLAGLGAIAAVVGGVMFLGSRTTPTPKVTATSGQSIVDYGRTAKTDWYLQLEELRPRLLAAAESMPRLKPGVAQLADAAIVGLATYSRGEYQDAKKWLESQGLKLHASMRDPLEGPKTWEAFTKCVKGAVFYPESAKIVRVVSDGKPVSRPNPRVNHGDFVGTRAYDDPGAVDTSARGVDVYEVRVDADLTSIEGKQFRAQVGLSFVQRPGTSTWQLVGFSLYDVPREYAVTLPPF